MQKALALCLAALLLLAGCLGTDDEEEVEEIVEEALEIIGCGDETSLTYAANVTNSSGDLCVYEDALENTIVDFISLIEDGPDMETLDSTVGYSMELSEVYVDMDDCYDWEYWNPDLVDESQPYNGCPDVVEEHIHYLETIVVSPTGYKATMEHSIDDETEISEIIISGNELQFSFTNDTEDYTVRMKHAGTFEDAMEGMMSDGEEDDMDGDNDDMVCYDMSTHTVQYDYYDQMDCESDGYMWVPADSGPSDDEDDFDMEEGDDPTASDYTQYFNPLSATITDYAPDETGYTFSGMLNIDDAPFSYLEIHTDSSFTVLGFTMEDTEEEDNWVEFMMISSGDTSTDETIALSALPYILFDMSDMSGDDDDDNDDEDYTFYCSNDGEDYAEAMGGILCPEGQGVTPECPNGEPCICIDVDGSCDDGDDDWGYFEDNDDNVDDDWEYMGPNFYENCDDAEGLSSYDCWDNEWDIDGDGIPEDSDSYWNYECQQHSNGTWECMTDHINYYDNCAYEDENYYECWLDEWDTDNDGSYDLGSDGYMDYECELLEDGRWACGHSEDMEEFHYYDYCTDEGDHYECWMDEWDYDNDGDYEESHGYNYSDCSEDESNGSWMCLVGNEDDHEDEDEETYYCTPFVEYNSAGFSIYDNSSLDESLCGTEVVGDTYEFDNSTFTMPTHLIWEECWEEHNGTVCEQGEIYYDVNTTMLWETTHENNYMDCDGDYDNNTSMCTEWLGNITDADGSAFLIENDWEDTLIMYQYDESTQSGLVIFVPSADDDDDDEMDLNSTFAMLDADEDGEVTASEWANMVNQTDGDMSEEDFNGLEMMIDLYDEDNTGGLNFDEFVNMMEQLDDGGDDDDGEWSFDRELQDCDSDDDAMVSYTELEACINEDLINDGFDFVNASQMGAHEFFNMTDMDNNGMLNESEFNELNALLSNSDDDDNDMDPEMMFDLFDSNDDGEVTASEWSDFTNSTDDPMSEEDFGFLSGMMDNYDDDDSGGLDYDEFMTFMGEMEDMEDGDGIGEDIAMFMAFGVMSFLGADVNDYMVELAMCDGMSLADLVCDDPVHSMALADIMYNSEEEAMMAMMTETMVFVDADSSGTLTSGDYLFVNNASVDGEWNFARLYSSEAGAYSDENPMMSMLPGFTGFIATIGLLGAALIRRE